MLPMPIPNYAIPDEIMQVFASASNSLAQLKQGNSKKKEHTMCYNCDLEDTILTDKTEYLLNRLSDIFEKKMQEAREAFGMGRIKGPKNRAETTEWLKAGRFEFDGVDDPKLEIQYGFGYSNIFTNFFRWTNPDKPRDEAGLKAFTEKLDDAYTDAIDTVKIKSADEGLAAVKEFEKYPVQ